MVDIKYANAYSEILEILKYISIEDYNKIPKDRIKLFETNSNKNYVFDYHPNLTLDEQNVSEITKIIIAILFRDYWATPKQREVIIAKEKYDREKEDEEKRERYNSDNLFKNNKQTSRQNHISQAETKVTLPVEIKKQNFFDRIIKFIKNTFKH